jgi:hypothetical protein
MGISEDGLVGIFHDAHRMGLKPTELRLSVDLLAQYLAEIVTERRYVVGDATQTAEGLEHFDKASGVYCRLVPDTELPEQTLRITLSGR